MFSTAIGCAPAGLLASRAADRLCGPFGMLLRGDGRRSGETALHIAPGAYRLGFRDLHVGPAHDVASGNIAAQRDLVSEADRQRAIGEAALGRDELAPHRVAAF